MNEDDRKFLEGRRRLPSLGLDIARLIDIIDGLLAEIRRLADGKGEK